MFNLFNFSFDLMQAGRLVSNALNSRIGLALLVVIFTVYMILPVINRIDDHLMALMTKAVIVEQFLKDVRNDYLARCK